MIDKKLHGTSDITVRNNVQNNFDDRNTFELKKPKSTVILLLNVIWKVFFDSRRIRHDRIRFKSTLYNFSINIKTESSCSGCNLHKLDWLEGKGDQQSIPASLNAFHNPPSIVDTFMEQ